MHIQGKKLKGELEKCAKLEIDHWEVEKTESNSILDQKEVHWGMIKTKTVYEYLYLGDHFRSDGSS